MTSSSPSLPPVAAGTQATVLLLASAGFFSGAALRVCDSLIPRLANDFAITPGTAGRVVLGFAIAYGLMQLVFGPLGDRYGKARLVCFAMFGCTAGSLAAALAPGFDGLVAARVLWGMAAAGVVPLSMAWIGDAVPYEQRQSTLARLLMGTLCGMMGGQLAGGLFADSAFGWRGAFFTLSAGYIVVATLITLRLRGTHTASASVLPRTSFVGQLSSVLRTPWARVVLAATLAEGILLLGPMAYLPTYLHQRYGLSLSAASASIALYAVGGLIYAVSARHIVRRFGERRMFLAGGILMGGGYLAWWLSPLGWLAGAIALGVGFGTYLFHNTLQTHATQMVPSMRGTAVSLFAACLFIGQAIGVALGGYAFDHFGAPVLLAVPGLGLPLVGFLLARALQRRTTALS